MTASKNTSRHCRFARAQGCRAILGNDWQKNAIAHGEVTSVSMIGDAPELTIDFGSLGSWLVCGDDVTLRGEPRKFFKALIPVPQLDAHAFEEVSIEIAI